MAAFLVNVRAIMPIITGIELAVTIPQRKKKYFEYTTSPPISCK
jgi:hypothetical protein